MSRSVCALLMVVGLSGCSFHGLQSVYHQETKANQTLGQIERDLRAIETKLSRR